MAFPRDPMTDELILLEAGLVQGDDEGQAASLELDHARDVVTLATTRHEKALASFVPVAGKFQARARPLPLFEDVLPHL